MLINSVNSNRKAFFFLFCPRRQRGISLEYQLDNLNLESNTKFDTDPLPLISAHQPPQLICRMCNYSRAQSLLTSVASSSSTVVYFRLCYDCKTLCLFPFTVSDPIFLSWCYSSLTLWLGVCEVLLCNAASGYSFIAVNERKFILQIVPCQVHVCLCYEKICDLASDLGDPPTKQIRKTGYWGSSTAPSIKLVCFGVNERWICPIKILCMWEGNIWMCCQVVWLQLFILCNERTTPHKQTDQVCRREIRLGLFFICLYMQRVAYYDFNATYFHSRW